MEETPYWYVTIKKDESLVEVYLDEEGKQALCIIKPAAETTPEETLQPQPPQEPLPEQPQPPQEQRPPQLPSQQNECNLDTECADNNPCTRDVCSGTPKKCANTAITSCETMDGCCPTGCSYSNDRDCENPNECWEDSDCDDNDPCTIDTCSGSPKKCNYGEITSCSMGDGCCPAGCTYTADRDCLPSTCSYTVTVCNDSYGTYRNQCINDRSLKEYRCYTTERPREDICKSYTKFCASNETCVARGCFQIAEASDCVAAIRETPSQGCDPGCSKCYCLSESHGVYTRATSDNYICVRVDLPDTPVNWLEKDYWDNTCSSSEANEGGCICGEYTCGGGSSEKYCCNNSCQDMPCS